MSVWKEWNKLSDWTNLMISLTLIWLIGFLCWSSISIHFQIQVTEKYGTEMCWDQSGQYVITATKIFTVFWSSISSRVLWIRKLARFIWILGGMREWVSDSWRQSSSSECDLSQRLTGEGEWWVAVWQMETQPPLFLTLSALVLQGTFKQPPFPNDL